MKRILISLFLFPILLFAQNKKPTTIDNVKAGIKRHLYLTMKDYKSYQSVQWGALEKIYFTFENTDRYSTLSDSLNKVHSPYSADFNFMELRAKTKGIDLKTDSLYLDYYKELKPIAEKMNLILNAIKKEKAEFKSRFLGYSIYHKYRGKNSYGAYSLSSNTFELDPKFKVTGVFDEDEDN